MSEPVIESTALFQPPKPGDVLLKEGALDGFIKDVIQPEINRFEMTADLTTKRGRDAVKSLAFKITRTATFLDGIGKELNAEARAQINVIDEARRHALTKLKKVRDDFRRPLDEWEANAAARDRKLVELFIFLRRASIVDTDTTSKTVAHRIRILETVLNGTADDLGGQYDEAVELRDASLAALNAALGRLKQQEADQAELATLRAAQAEHDRKDAERKAEADRRQEIIDESRRQEEERVKRESLAAALAEQRLITEKQKAVDEKAERAADAVHRTEVFEAAIKGLMTFAKLTEEQAQGVALAICDHQIPFVSINF